MEHDNVVPLLRLQPKANKQYEISPGPISDLILVLFPRLNAQEQTCFIMPYILNNIETRQTL
jgi:hypothetical protein